MDVLVSSQYNCDSEVCKMYCILKGVLQSDCKLYDNMDNEYLSHNPLRALLWIIVLKF